MPGEVLTGLSYEQLQQLIVVAVEAAKKPDAKTQAKLDEAEKREAQRMQDMLEAARVEIQTRECRWGICDCASKGRKCISGRCYHRAQRGESLMSGQVHSDGLFHPICVRCQYQPTPYKATSELADGTGASLL